jgi:hypothetical protein
MTLDDIERAANLLAEVEVKMGTVFKGMGRSEMSSLLNDAITYVTNSTIKDIPMWMFAKYFEGDMDKAAMDRVLITMEAMKLVEVWKRPGVDTIIHVREI